MGGSVDVSEGVHGGGHACTIPMHIGRKWVVGENGYERYDYVEGLWV